MASKRETFPLAAHTLLIRPDNHILLLRRTNTSYLLGHYTDPAGHIEIGESAEYAAAREVFEETGIRVDPLLLSLVHVIHAGPRITGDIYLHLFFRSEVWQGDPRDTGTGESDHMDWFPIAQLPTPMVPEVELAIRNHTHSPYSTINW